MHGYSYPTVADIVVWQKETVMVVEINKGKITSRNFEIKMVLA